MVHILHFDSIGLTFEICIQGTILLLLFCFNNLKTITYHFKLHILEEKKPNLLLTSTNQRKKKKTLAKCHFIKQSTGKILFYLMPRAICNSNKIPNIRLSELEFWDVISKWRLLQNKVQATVVCFTPLKQTSKRNICISQALFSQNTPIERLVCFA